MDAAPTRQICPVCDAPLAPDSAACSHCGTELRQLNPGSDPALDFYDRALEAAQAGNKEEALLQIRGAMAADPTDVDSYIVAGKLLAQQENYPEAIALWQRAQGLEPDGE